MLIKDRYTEMSYKELIAKRPDLAAVIWNNSPDMLNEEEVEDENYIVRFNREGVVEIGYPEDDWQLK
jgi:hypothetical protein